MPLPRRMALTFIATLGTFLTGLGGRQTTGGDVSYAARSTGVPPAAALLARRLGIRGQPFVGGQPRGSGRPWVLWFPGANSRSRCGYTGRPALFSGPRGVRGPFHFFDSSPLRPCGPDPYHGPPLSRARTVGTALAWLRHAGAPVPKSAMHIYMYTGTTIIGGTGLCCFRSLGLVYWGAGPTRPHFLPVPKNAVYVADRGTVVQVDMGGVAAAEALAHPCAGDHRDRQGVMVGPWCFSYVDAAGNVAFSRIGGHDGWTAEPEQVALTALHPVAPKLAPIRQITRSRTRAIFRLTAQGTSYDVTLVPAFPGLTGTPWETTFVRTVRTSTPD